MNVSPDELAIEKELRLDRFSDRNLRRPFFPF
jgi:hypothetical protein